MKNKMIYVLPGLFAIVFIVLVLIGNLGPNQACKDKRDFVGSSYNAVILKKYLDKENHNYKRVEYSYDKKLWIWTLLDDTSGFYEFVKIGDSISKHKGSEYIDVDKIKKFKIYFDCK